MQTPYDVSRACVAVLCAVLLTSCGKDAPPRVVENAIMETDAECRNGGEVRVNDTVWLNLGLQPEAWRAESTVQGQLNIQGDEAVFVDAAGRQVRMTNGAVEAICEQWAEVEQDPG